MKDYTFTLGDGKDVQVRIVGEYTEKSDHDWTIECGDFYEEVEEDDGQQVNDLIEKNFNLMPNQARFVSMVLVDVMGYGSMTLEEALDDQARYEEDQQKAPGYATKTDAIDQYIRPSLGDFAEDYDIDAIFDEAFRWRDGKLVLTIPEEEYYEVVARHDLSAN